MAPVLLQQRFLEQVDFLLTMGVDALQQHPQFFGNLADRQRIVGREPLQSGGNSAQRVAERIVVGPQRVDLR